MDTGEATNRLEAALGEQVSLAGGDPAVERAARALLAALRPASRQLAVELAEQAANEVSAQLPEHRVEVVLREGEPVLSVRTAEGEEPTPSEEEYEARITLRLPPSLKSALEAAAKGSGDSVNAHLVKGLSRITRSRGRAGNKVQGRIQT